VNCPLTVLATTINLTWKDIKAAFAQTRKYLVHTCKFGQVIYSSAGKLFCGYVNGG
jgi:hypothetical protein